MAAVLIGPTTKTTTTEPAGVVGEGLDFREMILG
jgi:hypothetical protein